jgi:hypothetical protein
MKLVHNYNQCGRCLKKNVLIFEIKGGMLMLICTDRKMLTRTLWANVRVEPFKAIIVGEAVEMAVA